MSDLTQYTVAELEQLLAEKKQKQQEEETRKIAAYEDSKNDLATELVAQAEQLNEALAVFHKMAYEELEAFYAIMLEFGDVSATNKGNFSIKSHCGSYKVVYKRQRVFEFDERSVLAEAKLREFINEHNILEKDPVSHDIILTLIEKNANNQFDPRLIQKLYKRENSFDKILSPAATKLLKDAIALFKQSYTESHTATYLQFQRRDKLGNYENINLNFSSLRLK